MGCNCRKKARQEPQVVKSVPQTPEELHTQQMMQWNGGNIKIQEDKQEN